MTIDLQQEQVITVLLPDGARLVLSHHDRITRLEHWHGSALLSLLSLPTNHDHHQPPCHNQQAHHNRLAPKPLYPASNTL